MAVSLLVTEMYQAFYTNLHSFLNVSPGIRQSITFKLVVFTLLQQQLSGYSSKALSDLNGSLCFICLTFLQHSFSIYELISRKKLANKKPAVEPDEYVLVFLRGCRGLLLNNLRCKHVLNLKNMSTVDLQMVQLLRLMLSGYSTLL